MIPWFIVTLVEHVAWAFGYTTYVRAMSRAGYKRGFGAERIYFRRRTGDEVLAKRLKPVR